MLFCVQQELNTAMTRVSRLVASSLFPLSAGLILSVRFSGGIAQLARAVALQAIGQGFESPYLQRQEADCAAESAVAETNVPRDFLAVSRVGPVSARLCERRLTRSCPP
jgi:hypothetical protein